LIDVLRRERRVASRELGADATDFPEPAADAGTSDSVDVEAIRAAVNALPPRQRQVIEQLKFEDRSVREVAGRLRMSESAVKVTAHRGYRALRRLLGDTRED
jgi:RNA polymerase sigma-70 factor (ECF subfamily)